MVLGRSVVWIRHVVLLALVVSVGGGFLAGCKGSSRPGPADPQFGGENEEREDAAIVRRTCPRDEPGGVRFRIQMPSRYGLAVVVNEAPADCSLAFELEDSFGTHTLTEDDSEPGRFVVEGRGLTAHLVIRIGSCDFDRIELDLTASYFLWPSHYRDHQKLVIYDACDHGDEPDAPPDDPPDDPDVPVPDFVYDIPDEARRDDTVTCVADKEEGACVVVGTEETAQPLLQAALSKMVTAFFRGIAPTSIGGFIRDGARVEAALLSDHAPLVADDAAPPEGTNPYIPRLDLFRVDMESGNTWRLTRHREEGGSVLNARWSPSGDRIAYLLRDHTDPTYPVRLRMLRPETGVTTALSDRSAGAVTWSPDGRTVAFVSGAELRAVEADGSNERRLFTAAEVLTGSTAFYDIDWHPTANRILAVVKPSGFLQGGRLFDLDQSTAVPLTDGRNDGLDPDTQAEDRYAVWSPDGQRIAFVRTTEEGDRRQMYLLDPGSGNPPDEVEMTTEYRFLDW